MADTKKYRTQKQVVQMLKKRGLGTRQARIGGAIACCEAPVLGAGVKEPTVDFGLVGDLDLQTEVWGPSYGGFQIRSLKAVTGSGELRDAERLVNPSMNCDAAVTIFRQSGWYPWSTYKSGMYQAYLQDLFPPPPNTHVVMAGETLSTIAPKYGVKWQDLARMNNIRSPYSIFINQHVLYALVDQPAGVPGE